MACELGTVVEGDGLAQFYRQVGEEPHEMPRNAVGGLVGRPGRQQQAGLALVDGEHGLTVSGEQHEVGFPVARGLAIGGLAGPFGHAHTAVNEACRTAAPAAAKPSPALAAGQIAPPAVVLGAGDLGVDEAIDALVADHRSAGLARQPSGDLFGRPARGEAVQDEAAQIGLAFEARARPAPRPALVLGVTGFVADFAAAIAPYLARDARWRAIQSCRDLPDRAPVGLKSGNLASIVQ